MNLTGIPIVETAISVVVAWALFAIFSSLVQEAFAQVLSERGRFLKRKLMDQLQDKPNEVNWALPLYMHGSVDLLSRAEEKPTTFIPPKVFAETLVETVAESQVLRQKLNPVVRKGDKEGEEYAKSLERAMAANHYQSPVLHNFKAATMVLAQSDVMNMMKQSLRSAEMQVGPAPDSKARPEWEAKVYQKLVENLAEWYGTFSGLVDGWYKKKVRYRLFLLGVVLATAFNVDTVQLFTYFQNQPKARTAMIAYYEQNAERLQALVPRDTGFAEADDALRAERVKESIEQARAFYQEMDSLRKATELPIGWERQWLTESDINGKAWQIFLKLLGIAFSGFAASFGAPFWFDLLKRVTRPTAHQL